MKYLDLSGQLLLLVGMCCHCSHVWGKEIQCSKGGILLYMDFILGYSRSPIFLYECEDQSLSLRGYHNLHIVKEICKNANCLSGQGCGATELPNMSVPILEQYFTPVIEVKGKCEVWCPWDQENCPQFRGVDIMDRDRDFEKFGVRPWDQGPVSRKSR